MAFFQTTVGAIILLIVGFVLLVKGADFFVEGASSVAKRLKIPALIIGLTIVAMGTSLPEAAVSISSSIQGSNSLAISNVTGSNIFNLMVVVGFCAIMAKSPVDRDTIRRDIPLSLLAAVLLIVFGATGMVTGRIEGLVLLLLFIGYIFLMIRSALKARATGQEVSTEAVEEAEKAEIISIPKSILFIVGGAAAVVFGGDWVVDSASTLASKMGLSETIIGLTIVAIGTSLPELVTSIVATRKGEVDMALGNAIGSNIFNILLIIGAAGAISPIGIIQNNLLDLAVLVVFTILVWVAVAKKKELKRPMGIVMVLLYAAYMVYIVLRDM
ncbi:MAG: calcium/sodium antiporter [Agathobacter sp.]|nr:calcium/sodium antiporter [Agathobacter sp.]